VGVWGFDGGLGGVGADVWWCFVLDVVGVFLSVCVCVRERERERERERYRDRETLCPPRQDLPQPNQTICKADPPAIPRRVRRREPQPTHGHALFFHLLSFTPPTSPILQPCYSSTSTEPPLHSTRHSVPRCRDHPKTTGNTEKHNTTTSHHLERLDATTVFEAIRRGGEEKPNCDKEKRSNAKK